MKKLITYILLICMIMTMTACSIFNNEKKDEEKKSGYEVKIDLDYNGIELDCKYDLNIKLADKDIGTMNFGEKEKSFDVDLDDGSYTLIVENKDNADVKGEIDFSVSEDTNLNYELICLEDKIEIKEVLPINVPIGSNEVEGKIIDDVSDMFSNAGFTKVEEKEVKDLTLDQKDKEFTIASVNIDDNTDFKKDDKFLSNAKVVIEYHIQKDIEMPKSESQLCTRNYEEVYRELEALGFNNIQLNEFAGTISSSSVKDAVCNVTIDGKSFNKGDVFPVDSEVIIQYYPQSGEQTTSNGGTQTTSNDYGRIYTSNNRNSILANRARRSARRYEKAAKKAEKASEKAAKAAEKAKKKASKKK